MPKKKNLNGIPHNITKSFFGTERYYDGGYMADWLLNAAKQLHLTSASLDVLNALFNPPELNIRPLTINAEDLKVIIEKELLRNGFDRNFIKEAFIDFKFPDLKENATMFYCYPYLIDIEGRKYEAEQMIEEGLEPEFDVFHKIKESYSKPELNILNEIRRLFE